jgi:hypothetical protein
MSTSFFDGFTAAVSAYGCFFPPFLDVKDLYSLHVFKPFRQKPDLAKRSKGGR